MRIISGKYKGRRLKTIEGLGVRPTSDRLRETLFNVLAPVIEETAFLDICAGSGAVGIEALSRGAASATFIEGSRKAATIIHENLEHCRVEEGARVVVRDALQAMKQLGGEGARFDIVFFDPPYDSEIYSPVMWQIAKNRIVTEGGIVIVEHRRQLPLSPSYGELRPYREIVQGESCLTFYRMEKSDTIA